MIRPPSAVLIGRAQTGDRDALNDVLRAIQSPLFDHIRSIVGDGDEAMDVLQTALLVVARKLPSLREPRWFRAWTYRIATREAIRLHRAGSRWREALRGDDIEALPVTVDDPPFDTDLVARLPGEIAQLPPACALVIRMHYIEGLSYEEIREALDVPIGTIKSRLSYGRQVLRSRMERGWKTEHSSYAKPQ